MNKEQYLSTLRKRLDQENVPDVEEILTEYEEHFDRKLADGFSEEEIAAKLGNPVEIAEQFSAGELAPREGAPKALVAASLVFVDIGAFSFFALLYAWAFCLAAVALACLTASLALIFRPAIPLFSIPPMPYGGALLLAVSMLGLSGASAIAAIYSARLISRLSSAYARWHRNTLNGGIYPRRAIFPIIGADKVRRRLRTAALVALTLFGVTLIIAYAVLAISAGSLEFWHVWHWFV